MADIKLYVIPASHPSMAAELMLKRKGLPYKRRDLISVAHIPILKANGFKQRTVPAIKSNGEKVQGTREISRWLDRVQPEPPLFPAANRAEVEEAERWGDEQLQSVPRRLAWFVLGRDRSDLKGFMEGYKIGLPTSVAVATAGPIIWAEQKINGANEDTIKADLAALPGLLSHVDELIAKGVIGTDEPNAADYQIGTSVRLLLAFEQIEPLVSERTATWARQIAPDPGGRIPAALPPEWLPA